MAYRKGMKYGACVLSMLHELVLEQKGEHRHSQLRLLLHLPYAFSRHRDAPDNSG